MTATVISQLTGHSGQLEYRARLIAAARGEDVDQGVQDAFGDHVDGVRS